jgi:hypothetical protein
MVGSGRLLKMLAGEPDNGLEADGYWSVRMVAMKANPLDFGDVFRVRGGGRTKAGVARRK